HRAHSPHPARSGARNRALARAATQGGGLAGDLPPLLGREPRVARALPGIFRRTTFRRSTAATRQNTIATPKMNTPTELNRLETKRWINARRDRVFAAWTKPDQVQNWFGPA